MLKQFDAQGAQLLGLSCDTSPSLKVWAASLGGIGYPLLSDFNPHGALSKALGIFNDANGFSLRSITIVDADGVVRAFEISPAGPIPEPAPVLATLTALRGV